MQGDDLVRRAIRFQHPARLPVVFDSLGRSDIGGCGLQFSSIQPVFCHGLPA